MAWLEITVHTNSAQIDDIAAKLTAGGGNIEHGRAFYHHFARFLQQ